jgi:hypothetical protein
MAGVRDRNVVAIVCGDQVPFREQFIGVKIFLYIWPKPIQPNGGGPQGAKGVAPW